MHRTKLVARIFLVFVIRLIAGSTRSFQQTGNYHNDSITPLPHSVDIGLTLG